MFWTKIFAISFGMGVVSGIIMPFQFGTNWSRYSDAMANIVSPLLGYEGLTAFFLEAGFLGVLLFGRKLVPPWAHFFSALMVALGTLLSTFWILSNNSWMQTPAGYDDRGRPVRPEGLVRDHLQPVVSLPARPHRGRGFYVTTGFMVLGVAAYWLLRRRFVEESRVMLSMTLWLLRVLVPLQIFIGDAHGPQHAQYQPAKLAAIEAHLGRRLPLPLTLFAIPDDLDAKNHLRDRDPGHGQPDPHPRRGRVGARPEGLSARPTARRPLCRSSPSGSCSASGLMMLAIVVVAGGCGPGGS